MPVDESTRLERVSTAMTWGDLSFHGQYLRQFAVLTSSQEYSNVQSESKTLMAKSGGDRSGRCRA